MESLPPRRACRKSSASRRAFERIVEQQQRRLPQAEEEKYFETLVCAYKELPRTDDDEYPDKMGTFLTVLETAVRALDVETESRSYRDNFHSGYYRSLLPDNNPNYLVDVFDASLSHPVLWINGEEFHMSPKFIARAKALQDAFAWLRNSLGVENAHSPPLQLLRCQLGRLDKAWANFEMTYINELIAVEDRSKEPLVQAIKEESLLRQAEKQKPVVDSTQVHEQRRRLVSCINKLNSVANERGKGRADLDASILEDVEKHIVSEYKRRNSASARAAGALTRSMVDSFNAIRIYLSRVATCLDQVDPALAKNEGLVDHLVAWEETWETVAKYINDKPVFSALVSLVEKLGSVGQKVPGFKDMCFERDVELFFSIPRIIWILYLDKPADCKALLDTFLPHHFSACTNPDPILKFQRSFAELRQLYRTQIVEAQGGIIDPTCLLDILIQRALSGSIASTTFDDILRVDSSIEVVDEVFIEAVDAFVHDIERWSIELQRHSALEWNKCCSLLVQSLDDTTKNASKAKEFRM